MFLVGEHYLARSASSRCDEVAFENLIKSDKYEEAADLLHASMFPDAFDRQLNHSCRVERDKLKGAVRYLPSLFPQLLLTTNFDQVLEDIYAEEGLEINQVLPGADLASFRIISSSKKTRLVKLHGDYRNPTTRIFTSQEYEAAYRIESNLSIGFKNIVFNYNLLFMGASLINDRTLVALRELAPQRTGSHVHYAFLRYISNKKDRLRREDELMEARISPIWFPVPSRRATSADYDAQMEALFVGLLDRTGKLKLEE